MAPEMVPLNLSLDIDRRLWRHDIQGSRAWAQALVGAGVLTAQEGDALRAGLTRVEARLSEAGLDGPTPKSFPDEDIHSLVERLLYEEIGEVAGKLHTGRSRNDQVATDFRLWGMEAASRLVEGLTDVAWALVDLAERNVDLIIPGYTHLQQGQPVRAAHWALSHFWPLARDRARLIHARATTGVLPLGSGALAGCPFPVDRVALASALGFGEVTQNSIDAVSDRVTAMLAVLKGLPTGYNRDLQEDKRIVFDSVDALAVLLPALYGAVSTAEFRRDRVHDALDTKLLATDLADYLVRKGVPFRRSHDAIGHLVRRAEELSCQIEDLSDAEFRSAHPAFEADVREVFDWERSVDSRGTIGGTARSAIEEQLAAAREAIGVRRRQIQE
jgi:argininosuccinate lyase